MPLAKRMLGALLIAGALAACALVTGLNDFSKEDPTDAGATKSTLDTGADSRGSGSQGDATGGTAVDAPGDDASDDSDASEPTDSGESEVGDDAARDTGGDETQTDAGGAPPDAAACALACNTTTGTPSCNAAGTSCTYACSQGHFDCNASTAPDTDGCECAGTGCCGAGCQTPHNSGITAPASYYDCSATGNTTQTQAMAACTGTGGSGCGNKNTTCGGFFGFGGTSTSAACGTVSGTCYCWVYSGQNAGQVANGASGCNIPCASGSSWN